MPETLCGTYGSSSRAISSSLNQLHEGIGVMFATRRRRRAAALKFYSSVGLDIRHIERLQGRRPGITAIAPA